METYFNGYSELLMTTPKHKQALILFIYLTVSTLVSCGGGTGNNNTNNSGAATGNEPVKPAQATISYHSTKIFRFTWADVDDATYYRVLENSDGISGYTNISGDIPTDKQVFEYRLEDGLFTKLDSRYILQSCNSKGCVDDSPVFVSGNLSEAIGYLKPSLSWDLQDAFGSSLSLSNDGNILAVGAPSHHYAVNEVSAWGPGTVHIFYRNPDKIWQQQQLLLPPNTNTYEKFGISVSLSGDGKTLAIGAELYYTSALGFVGATYIYEQNTIGEWILQSTLLSPNPGSGDYFGGSLALSDDGNTLIVGARGEDSSTRGINSSPDNGATDSGAVYIYSKQDGAWDQNPPIYIKSFNSDAGDNFGTSVTVSSDGTLLVVGAPYEDSLSRQRSTQDNLGTDTGAAYFYRKSPNGNWSFSQYIKPTTSHISNGDHFGLSVEISGDGNVIAVGAPSERSDATGVNQTPNENINDAGAVFIFNPSIGFTQATYIKPTIICNLCKFGTSIKLNENGSLIVIGANNDRVNLTGLSKVASPVFHVEFLGGVYTYTKSNLESTLAWSPSTYIKPPKYINSSKFGNAIALDQEGKVLAVGESHENSISTGINSIPERGGNTDYIGAVYIY